MLVLTFLLIACTRDLKTARSKLLRKLPHLHRSGGIGIVYWLTNKKKQSHRVLKRRYSLFNLFCFKQFSATFRHVCREAEREYYRNTFTQCAVGSADFYKLIRTRKSKERILGCSTFTSPLNEVLSQTNALTSRWDAPPLPPV